MTESTELLKEESYQNFGGVNLKVSPYKTGVTELLDCRNYTLERLGALTSRPGTELHLTLPVSQYINKPFNTYIFNQVNGSSFTIFDSGPTLYSLGSTLQAIGGSLTANATTSTIIDFVTAENKMYITINGLFSYNGTGELLKTSLSEISSTTPRPNQATFNTGLGGATVTIPADSFHIRAAWLRGTPSLTDGLINSLFTVGRAKFDLPAENGLSLLVIGTTIVSEGLFQAWGFTAPPNEGVSSIALAYSRLGTGITNFIYAMPQSFTLTTVSGVTTYLANFPYTTTSQFDYGVRSPTATPAQRLAYFNNMLVTANNNTLSFSTLEDIESFLPENTFDISGNPTDSIVAMVTFQDSLIVFKRDSIHEVTGDSPETVAIADVTFDYGITNERGFCVFENRLFFVDQKGIAEYNGANTKIVSDHLEPVLDVTNKNIMSGVHVKKLNQVWFSDDQTTFVYDYIANAWLFNDGNSLDKNSGLFNVPYPNQRQDVFFWKSGQSFHQGIRFGSSLMTDVGSEINLVGQTRFHKRLGETTDEMWRRFYLNIDPWGPRLGLRFLLGLTIQIQSVL